MMAPGVFTIVVLAGIATAGLVALARIFSDNRTRVLLSERGLSTDEIRAVIETSSPPGYGALRSALLLLFTGGALMIAQYLPFDSRDPFVYGLVAFAGGLGLLAYQLVLSSIRRRGEG